MSHVATARRRVIRRFDARLRLLRKTQRLQAILVLLMEVVQATATTLVLVTLTTLVEQSLLPEEKLNGPVEAVAAVAAVVAGRYRKS